MPNDRLTRIAEQWRSSGVGISNADVQWLIDEAQRLERALQEANAVNAIAVALRISVAQANDTLVELANGIDAAAVQAAKGGPHA